MTDPTSNPMDRATKSPPSAETGRSSCWWTIAAENREMYAEYLADEFRIAQAGDGPEALEMVLALSPDLVVMDLMLRR